MATPSCEERITWRVPVPCTCLTKHADEEFTVVALSPRESYAARCLLRGYSNQQIAAELSICLRSAKKYMTVVMRKLGVPNRTAAALMLVKHGVTSD